MIHRVALSNQDKSMYFYIVPCFAVYYTKEIIFLTHRGAKRI